MPNGTHAETGEAFETLPGWQEGDTRAAFAHNADLLATAEYEAVKAVKAVMQSTGETRLEDLQWDPKSDNVIHGPTRSRLSKRDFGKIVSGLDSGRSGVGQATLSRALVTRQAFQSEESGGLSLDHLGAAEVHSRGGETDGSSDELFTLLGEKAIFYSRPGASGGATLGSQSSGAGELGKVIEDGKKVLNRKLPGLIHEKTHIFSSAEELLTSDYAKQHPFTDKERADIATAEGFFDKSTSATVIIAGNIALRKGESASHAFARVVIHERIGHDGINILLGDKRFKQRWQALMGRIPKTELEAIAAEEAYQDLANKPHALALEWLARRTESDPTLLEKPGLVREMWEAFKERIRTVFEAIGLTNLDNRDFDTEVRSLLRQARGTTLKGKPPHSSAGATRGLQLSNPQGNQAPSESSSQGAPIDKSPITDQINLTEQAAKNQPTFHALRALTHTASTFNLLGRGGKTGGSPQALDDVRSRENRSADETQPGVASGERGENHGIREEFRRLADWAKLNRAVFDGSRLGGKHDDGGEHTIYRSKEDPTRFFKVTHPGTAGLSLQTKQGKEGPIAGQSSGSVRDYLIRLVLANVVLRDNLRLEGVLTKGEPSLVISQPIREGSYPEPQDVNKFLQSIGFERVDTYIWYRSTDGIALGDTKPWNFLTPDEGKTILPVDISIRFATPEMTEAWGHPPPPDSPLRQWLEKQIQMNQ